jgi:hypothetical protein
MIRSVDAPLVDRLFAPAPLPPLYRRRSVGKDIYKSGLDPHSVRWAVPYVVEREEECNACPVDVEDNRLVDLGRLSYPWPLRPFQRLDGSCDRLLGGVCGSFGLAYERLGTLGLLFHLNRQRSSSAHLLRECGSLAVGLNRQFVGYLQTRFSSRSVALSSLPIEGQRRPS